MLIEKETITGITMIENEHNDFCVVFHIGKKGREGKIIIPCYFSSGFPIDHPVFAEMKANLPYKRIHRQSL